MGRILDEGKPVLLRDLPNGVEVRRVPGKMYG